MMKIFYQCLILEVLLLGAWNGYAQNPASEATLQQTSALSVYQSGQQLEQLSKETNERKLSPAAARTPLDTILGFR
ncbi:MAG: mechanosensitive ion channel family protein, partial [Luminiphilus sp.]|nr:mechanosensitive ion channel family protein [Luminiphilus sp.]